jgi:AAA ATPase-like protein
MTTAELIGRDHPAALLRAEIGRATDSHGGLVLVTGEAGIGKTTLVTDGMEAARQAGALVLSGSCWDSAAAPGYWPWVQVMRALRRQAGDADWVGGLEVLLGEAGAHRPQDGFQIYDAVTSALVAAAQRRPVVVVLDDLHWADPESVRLLEFVAQHTWFERLLLVGTYRDVEVEATDHPLAPLMLPLLARATTITLTGLDRAEVGALIARTTGVVPDDDLAGEVHRRTGGNPFFVEQTARLWHSGNALTAVAPGVRDAVRRRLALLPEPVAGLLTDAAVLGREFHRQVLAATVSVPAAAVDRLLAEAVSARLVSALGDGRFAFAHDLVRETLYDALDEAEARRRHAAVVRALGRSASLAERIFPADRARHGYLAGGEVEPGVVVDLLTAAAEDARRRMSGEEMIGHLRRARDLLAPGDRRRARVSLDLGVQYHHHNQADEADAAFREAADVALGLDVAEPLVRVALTLWGYSDARGTLREDLMRATHARLVGDAADKPLDRLAQEVILHVISDARSDNDDDALGFSLWTQHDTLWEPGNARQRQALTDELVTIAQRTGDVEMEMYATSLGWVAAIEQGDPRFVDRYATFRRLSDRNPVPSMRAGAFIDGSIIAALQGRFAEAAEALDDAFAMLPGEETLYFSYMGHQLRWSLLLVQGRFAELEELHRASAGMKYPHPALLAGITAATAGDAATAARCLSEIGPVTGPFAAMLLRLKAHVACLTRSPAAIEEARAGLAPLAGGWLVGIYGCDIAGPVDHWLALLSAAESDVDAAVAGFRAALRSAEALGARPWVIEAKLGLASVVAPAESAALRASAGEEAAELGVRHRASIPGTVPSANEFRLAGDTWSLTMAGTTVHVPDAKGLRDLHNLLSAPGKEIPATELLNPAGGAEVTAAAAMPGDDILDQEARSAYRRRLSTLDEEIDAAASRGDDAKAATLDREREALLRQLRTAAGLGNRPRRLGDESERARKTVTARIRDTLRKLDDRHPDLAAHLRKSVSTGATCSYLPAEPTTWKL